MGLGTTRYRHYFTQYAEELNGSHTEDPISTYAAVTVAQGGDIGNGIIDSLQRGKGVQLKRYYQYARARFGNRFWNWKLETSSGNSGKTNLSKQLAKLFITNLNPYTYVASVTTTPNQLGPYLNHLVKIKYGIDEFNTTYNGKNFEASSLSKSDKGVSVLKNTTDADPPLLYLDDFPEPSVGIIYWDYSVPVLVSSKITKEEYTFDKIPKGYALGVGTRVFIKEWAEGYDPFGPKDSGSTSIDNKKPEELDKEQEESSVITSGYKRKIYRRYATNTGSYWITESGERVTYYKFDVEVETHEITYDKETILYATQSGESNSAALQAFFDNQKKPKKVIAAEITSETIPHAFKLYPYLPIKDFGEDAWEDTWLVPKLAKTDEIVKLQKIIDDALKEQEDEKGKNYAAIHEPNQNNPRLLSKDKKDERKGGSKKYIYKGELHSLRSLQRRLARYLDQTRKIKFNKLHNPAKELTESATKRHIDNLAEMLGVNIEALAVSMLADPNYEDGSTSIKQRSVMPAVKFSSDLAEVQGYWFEFFKRMYDLYGRERDFAEWINAVSNSNNFNDLPMKKFTWKNQSELDFGGMSWLYIRKIQLKGNVRKIRRMRRVKEIKRGKPIQVNTIEELKSIIEPPREFANDGYYTSGKGVQHCTGGQKYITEGTMDRKVSLPYVMQDYSYTYFCKQTGPDTVEAYAVAGLCFMTKMIQKVHWAQAWYDLGLQYSRNVNTYINRKKDFSALYDMEHRVSKRHYYITRVAHFGIMPIDYNIIRRMGAVELERLAVRVPLLYGFTHSESKGKSKGLKLVLNIVQVIVAIVGAILTAPSGGSSNAGAAAANATIQALIRTVVSAVIVSLVFKYALMPLLKAIGLKGIIAVIVAIIIMLAASYLGGQMMNNQSAMPYGSEVGGQTATQVSAEVVQSSQSILDSIVQSVQETITNITTTLKTFGDSVSTLTAESLTQSVKEGIQSGLSQIINMSSFDALSMLTQAGLQTYNSENAQKLAKLQVQSEEETARYEAAQRELRELQDTIKNASYDVKAVLEAQRMRFRMYDPTSFLASNTTPDTYSASFDYLSNFINMKLNVDPATTDVAMTPDFSFVNPYKTV